MIYFHTYNTDIGYIRITSDGRAVTRIDLNAPEPSSVETEIPLLHEACIQIAGYLRGSRCRFNLPVAPDGTAFQLNIWAEVQRIPYGRTRSYRDMASAAGNVRACRAAGGAVGANPLPVLIPCHRVVTADGSIGGYSGGLEIKRKLLALEAANMQYYPYGKGETLF